MRARVLKMIVVGGLTTLLAIAQEVQPSPSRVATQSADTRPKPDAVGTYRKGPGVVMPQVTYQVNPEFSEKARKKKINGSCLVSLVVDAQGIPQNVHIVRSIADAQAPKDRKAALSLDEKAVEAVRQYRFSPATLHGEAVPVELKVEVSFQIF